MQASLKNSHNASTTTDNHNIQFQNPKANMQSCCLESINERQDTKQQRDND